MSKIIVSSTEKTVTIQQTGLPGPGVAPGGTTGQVLAKASNTDYDTEWVTGGGGGGSSTFIGLTDTPGAFVADRIVAVNAAGDALEFPTASAARTLIGLGTAATSSTGDFAAASHTHTASQVTDFATAADARIASASIDGLADVAITTPASGQVLRWTGSGWANAQLAYTDLASVPSTFTPSAHTHTLADVTDAGTAAASAATDFATAAQGSLADSAVQPGDLAAVATSGDYDDLSNLPALFDGAYPSLSGIPSTFTPSAHTHTASHVTDFATAADARIAAASIGDLSNVNLTGLAANKILEYNGSAFVLIDTPSGGGGSTTLGGLTDVTITGPLGTTDVLAWNGSNWADVDVNGLIASYLTGIAELTDISDVTVFSPSAGDVLRWNGSGWVNAVLAYSDLSGTPSLATVATSGDYDDLTNKPTLFDGAYSSLSGIPSTFTPSSHTLTSHSDVTLSLTSSGEFLRFDGSVWRNALIGSGDVPNLPTSKITSGTFDNARISQSSVTQHQAALSILGSQVTGKAGPGASFDGGGAAIADGVIVRSPVTEAGTVSTVYAVADQSGSVSVIVRRYAAADTSFASPTVLGTLSISTAQVGSLGSLSQAVAVGDVLEFEIDGAATSIERLAVRARI